MSMATLEIGAIGFAQVGQPDYQEKASFEGKFLRKKIIEALGEPPLGSSLRWKSNPHDFGTYYEMVLKCYIDIDNDDEMSPMVKKIWGYFERCENLKIENLEEKCRLEYEKEKKDEN